MLSISRWKAGNPQGGTSDMMRTSESEHQSRCHEPRAMEERLGGHMPRTPIAICLVAMMLPGAAVAQGKGIRLWNLTTATISGFQLSPAGKNDWGPNQTLNDRDKEVDHDERLRITGVEPGRYDAKVSYRDARQCFVRDLEIKAEAVFSIADKDLKDCNK
jgi:hypothetical protein